MILLQSVSETLIVLSSFGLFITSASYVLFSVIKLILSSYLKSDQANKPISKPFYALKRFFSDENYRYLRILFFVSIILFILVLVIGVLGILVYNQWAIRQG